SVCVTYLDVNGRLFSEYASLDMPVNELMYAHYPDAPGNLLFRDQITGILVPPHAPVSRLTCINGHSTVKVHLPYGARAPMWFVHPQPQTAFPVLLPQMRSYPYQSEPLSPTQHRIFPRPHLDHSPNGGPALNDNLSPEAYSTTSHSPANSVPLPGISRIIDAIPPVQPGHGVRGQP
ncbi:hypothetical protein IWW50_004703, partial [Coemansia erecta]